MARQNKMLSWLLMAFIPAEPDGVDASMLLLKDLSTGKIRMPDNVVLAVIPILTSVAP